MRQAPDGPRAGLVRLEPRPLAHGDALGGRRRAQAHAPRSSCILTLPGDAILYQGDELGLEDGAVPPDRILDLADPPRDPERTPFPWTRERRGVARPVAAARRHVTQRRGQLADPGSTLSYTRELIAQRKEFGDESYRTLPSAHGVWAYARGDKTCVLNMTDDTVGHEGRDTRAHGRE